MKNKRQTVASPATKDNQNELAFTQATKDGPHATAFPYSDYLKAKNDLHQAMQQTTCFYAMVSGASGMGKTSLLRDLQNSLDHHRYHILYLSSSLISAVGIVRALSLQLHVTPRRGYLETVNILAERICDQSSHVLLWVDEADQVQRDTLQEIRMVAESTLKSAQLFSLVLSGLPALSAKLDAPDLFPLKRRITLRVILSGLRREELAPFLQHRFGHQDAARFVPELHDELFERTQGTPALIDNICRHALSKHQSTTGPIDVEVFHAMLETAAF